MQSNFHFNRHLTLCPLTSYRLLETSLRGFRVVWQRNAAAARQSEGQGNMTPDSSACELAEAEQRTSLHCLSAGW